MKNSWVKSCLGPIGTTGLWDWDTGLGYLTGAWIYFGKSLFGTNLSDSVRPASESQCPPVWVVAKHIAGHLWPCSFWPTSLKSVGSNGD